MEPAPRLTHLTLNHLLHSRRFITAAACLLALLFLGGLISLRTVPTYTGPFDPHGPDKNCADFPDQRTAQSFYIAAGGPRSDPHRLDADHDGIACEDLSSVPLDYEIFFAAIVLAGFYLYASAQPSKRTPAT